MQLQTSELDKLSCPVYTVELTVWFPVKDPTFMYLSL